MPESVTNQLIKAIRADGYCLFLIDGSATGCGPVTFTAWRQEEGEILRDSMERWKGTGPTQYEAAVALAQSLGWELD